MSNITLKYFDGKGRGEAIRLTLAVGNIPFKDDRISFAKLADLKKTKELPFDQVPVMIVDGKTVSQSGAILRYCGKLAGLYPKDDLIAAARIDEMLCAMEDLVTAAAGVFGVKDPEKLKEALNALLEVATPRFVKGVDRIRGENNNAKFLCGNNISIADLFLYAIVRMIRDKEIKNVPKDLLDKSSTLMKSYKETNKHPKIVEWYKGKAQS